MGYRRLFIMRKDLNMNPGKLAAQVSHCAEAFWTKMICEMVDDREEFEPIFPVRGYIAADIFDNYVNGRFTKTICEARNKSHLLKAVEIAESMGFTEGEEFGLIYDACFTELEPEEEDGTTLTGIWFAPLPDETAHAISKKYQLYK